MKRNWGSLKYEIEKVDRRWKFSYIFFLCSTPRVVLCGSLELSGTRLFSIGFRVLCTLCKFDHHTWMGTRSNCLEQSSACICLEKKQFLICKAKQLVPCFRRSDWLWLRGNGEREKYGRSLLTSLFRFASLRGRIRGGCICRKMRGHPPPEYIYHWGPQKWDFRHSGPVSEL